MGPFGAKRGVDNAQLQVIYGRLRYYIYDNELSLLKSIADNA